MMHLTDEEKRAIYLQEKAKEEAKAKEKELKRLEYKEFTEETILSLFEYLQKVSLEFKDAKKKVVDELTTLIEIKKEIYGDDKIEKQFSNTFSTKDGIYSIMIGQNLTDNYDDTVNVGIDKIQNFIKSLATSEDAKKLVDTVLRLLSKDQKGNLKASRVLQLQKLAEEFGNDEFLDGVKIIRDSYQPSKSSIYIKAFYKDDKGNKIYVPLSLTDA